MINDKSSLYTNNHNLGKVEKEERVIEYYKDLIYITFGFEPKVVLKENTSNVYTLMTDGTPDERKQMMGKNSQNFKAIKHFVHIFARRHFCSVYIYIEPSDDRR